MIQTVNELILEYIICIICIILIYLLFNGLFINIFIDFTAFVIIN